MTIRARLEDAHFLHQHGRYEGALLSVLVAAAASSRRRFPKGAAPSRTNPAKDMGDREAFETFIAEQLPVVSDRGVFRVWFQGQLRPIGEVFYKWLRCTLAHEAELPPEIQFVTNPRPRGLLVRHLAGPPEAIMLSHNLVIFLADMVARAPENADLPARLRDSIMQLMDPQPGPPAM